MNSQHFSWFSLQVTDLALMHYSGKIFLLICMCYILQLSALEDTDQGEE